VGALVEYNVEYKKGNLEGPFLAYSLDSLTLQGRKIACRQVYVQDGSTSGDRRL